MAYAGYVDLDELPAYARQKLLTLKHGEKGDLATHLGVSAGNVSHWITGRRQVPLDQVKGILGFFNQRIDAQVLPTPAPQAGAEAKGGEG